MKLFIKSKIHPRMVYNLFYRHYCSNTTEKIKESKTENIVCTSSNISEVPEAPTTCCMTGCPNCVWLDYAEKLTEFFRDGGEKAWEEINLHVSDPNVKAYLMHELRMRNNNFLSYEESTRRLSLPSTRDKEELEYNENSVPKKTKIKEDFKQTNKMKKQ